MKWNAGEVAGPSRASVGAIRQCRCTKRRRSRLAAAPKTRAWVDGSFPIVRVPRNPLQVRLAGRTPEVGRRSPRSVGSSRVQEDSLLLPTVAASFAATAVWLAIRRRETLDADTQFRRRVRDLALLCRSIGLRVQPTPTGTELEAQFSSIVRSGIQLPVNAAMRSTRVSTRVKGNIWPPPGTIQSSLSGASP